MLKWEKVTQEILRKEMSAFTEYQDWCLALTPYFFCAVKSWLRLSVNVSILLSGETAGEKINSEDHVTSSSWIYQITNVHFHCNSWMTQNEKMEKHSSKLLNQQRVKSFVLFPETNTLKVTWQELMLQWLDWLSSLASSCRENKKCHQTPTHCQFLFVFIICMFCC